MVVVVLVAMVAAAAVVVFEEVLKVVVLQYMCIRLKTCSASDVCGHIFGTLRPVTLTLADLTYLFMAAESSGRLLQRPTVTGR